MRKVQFRNSLLLLLTALIWGVAFVAQSVGGSCGAFTFNCIRSLVGGFFLIPCIAVLNKFSPSKSEKASPTAEEKKKRSKTLLAGGVCCGLVICFASSFQQFGIKYTSVGKAGFITAFYIIIVPLLGLFFKKKCGPLIWIGVLLALVGLYFLCITEDFSIQFGDILMFICAIAFSVHILVIDHFTQLVDGVKMSCIQFIVCGVVSGILMLLFEQPSLTQILSLWQPILYAGILSCGVAYTLQIVAQKGMNPTVASLILSLESVVSVFAGFLILGQKLHNREILGCILMFCAIVFAQIPQKSKEEIGG
ncbi:DMT family transporter [Lachnospiraceae bacterium ZAX-1]